MASACALRLQTKTSIWAQQVVAKTSRNGQVEPWSDISQLVAAAKPG
jgi:hypothetical protein